MKDALYWQLLTKNSIKVMLKRNFTASEYLVKNLSTSMPEFFYKNKLNKYTFSGILILLSWAEIYLVVKVDFVSNLQVYI